MSKFATCAVALAVAFSFIGFSSPAHAAQGAKAKPAHAMHTGKTLPDTAMNVTLKGINVPNGADQSHNALRVTKAIGPNGKAIRALVGKTITYNDDANGKQLMSGYAKDRVQVMGTLSPDHKTLTVSSFQKIGAKHHMRLHHHRMAKAAAKAPATTGAAAPTATPAAAK